MPPPNNYTCGFVIPSGPANSNGARLNGGFPPMPHLISGDSIQVTVQTTGQGGPSTLNGYMIISPAANVPNQTNPSPFKDNNSKFICFTSQMGVAGTNGPGPNTTFTFNRLTYNGSLQGNYELTFVAEDPATGTQWSEDPEFDTDP